MWSEGPHIARRDHFLKKERSQALHEQGEKGKNNANIGKVDDSFCSENEVSEWKNL